MKIRLTSYTFDASEKTIVHTSFSDVGLEGIQVITNVTDGIIIYNFADPALGGTLSTDTLTLDYDTTSMSDSDKLMILVEDGTSTQPVSGTVAVTNAGLTELAGAIDTEMQVDVVAALPAGNNNIGDVDVASIAAGDNNIGNVDIVTLPGDVEADIDQIRDQIDLIVPDIEEIRVDADAIRIAVETIDNAISGSEMQVDVLTMPTTTVQATNLDIRDLAQVSDSVRSYANTAKDGSGTAYIPLVDTDGHLQVDVLSGGGGGIQYTEGDTDASITGTALLFEGAADTLVAAPGTAANGLDVDVTRVSGTVTVDGSGVTQPVSHGALTELAAAINSSKVDVNIVSDGATLATTAKQDTIIGHVDGIEGLLTTIDADTGNIATSVANIDTDTTTIIGHLDGVEGLLTTIAGDTTDIEAAIEIIDNTIVVLGTDTYTEATSSGQVIGAVRRDADTTLVNTTNEYGPLQMDANGRLKVEAFSGETLPVSLTSTTVTGTVAVTQSGTWDEIGINDSGNSITVDYATTGSGTATGALRVELPTNGTGVIATVGAVTAITNALPAGNNNIGDMDVASLPVAFNAGAVGATTQRVITATDAGAAGRLAANSGVDIGDVDVTSAVTATIDHGSNLDIDAAAEQITSTSFACKFGVTLKADATNPGILYIGNSDVTAGSTAATDGIPLHPGDSLFLPVTNSNIPYAIGSVANNKIYWVAA